MDDMGHVRVLWLGRGTVCRHVEVARDLGERCKFQESSWLPQRWGGRSSPWSQTDLDRDPSVVRAMGLWRSYCPSLSLRPLVCRMGAGTEATRGGCWDYGVRTQLGTWHRPGLEMAAAHQLLPGCWPHGGLNL